MNQLIGRSFIRSGICFIPLLCWTPASAQTGAEIPFVENVFPEWGLTGSLSLRFDDLIVRGNEANNSFSSQGGQYLGNFDLGISRRFSQYNTLEGQISGALNFSDLRSDSTGFVPERASLTWTYGEGALPLRVTSGDFFASFTPLTLNTSLKGVLVDVQSPGRLFGADHSVQAFAGSRLQSFRDTDLFDDQIHYGLSTLSQWDNTSVSFNWSTAELASDISATGETVVRSATSLAFVHDREFSNGGLSLSAELAGSFGDAQTNDVNEDRSGIGGYAEVAGNFGSINYRGRFEQFDEGYSPIGASVEDDRQTVRFELGKSFSNGFSAQLRGEQIRENLSQLTGPESTTQTIGANIRGGINKTSFLPSINGTFDVFVQEDDTSDDSRSNRNFVANFNANAAISDQTSVTFGLLFNDNDDLVGDSDRRSRQAQFGLRRTVGFFGFKGAVNSGFVVRDLDDGDGRDVDYGPNVDLSLKREAHSLRLNANYLSQQPGNDAADINTLRYGMRYTYKQGPHELQLHASVDRRSPEFDDRTESIRFGASYRINFQKTPRSQRSTNGLGSRAIQSQSLAQSAQGLTIDQFIPGVDIGDAFSVLQAAGASGAVPFGDALVFERRYFSQVQNRQRLVILRDPSQTTLDTAAVVIDVDEARGEQGLRTLIDVVRDELARSYGRPNVIEQGAINGNVRDAILDGEFIYLAEWKLPDGDLRLGLPVRLDGQIRLEVQYKASFPSTNETDWSIEDVF